jgi:hypothetical protein
MTSSLEGNELPLSTLKSLIEAIKATFAPGTVPGRISAITMAIRTRLQQWAPAWARILQYRLEARCDSYQPLRQ